jgi:hypothetical protein
LGCDTIDEKRDGMVWMQRKNVGGNRGENQDEVVVVLTFLRAEYDERGREGGCQGSVSD